MLFQIKLCLIANIQERRCLLMVVKHDVKLKEEQCAIGMIYMQAIFHRRVDFLVSVITIVFVGPTRLVVPR